MILPLDFTKTLYLMLTGFIVGLANAGGLGGGGAVSVPLLIILFGYETKYAIGLGYIFVFWGGMGNYLQNCNKYHPYETASPLVSYQTALIAIPGIIYGAVLGYFFNQLCPAAGVAQPQAHTNRASRP